MAHTITVSAGFIGNFQHVQVAGADVTIKGRLNTGGIDADGVPRERGTGPVVTGTVYVWDSGQSRFEDDLGNALSAPTPAPVEADGPYILYIPAFPIVPTSNWLRPKNAAYDFYFTLPNGSTVKWEDMQQIRVDASLSPTTWMGLSLFSKGVGPRMFIPMTYSREEVDALIDAAQAAGLVNPMTAVGDLIRGGTVTDGAASPTALPIGSSGNFLKVSAGIPAWGALTSGEIATALGYTPANATHTHTAADIADFSTAVDARITNGAVLAAIGYTPSAVGHAHTAASITDFSSAVDARITSGAVLAALGYTPSAVGHTHVNADITDFDAGVEASALAGLSTLKLGTLIGTPQTVAGGATASLSANTLLVIGQGGASGCTLNLTDAVAGELGRVVIVVNNNPSGAPGNVVTVNAFAGNDFVRNGTTTSTFNVGAGETAVLIVTDTGRWNYHIDS